MKYRNHILTLKIIKWIAILGITYIAIISLSGCSVVFPLGKNAKYGSIQCEVSYVSPYWTQNNQIPVNFAK